MLPFEIERQKNIARFRAVLAETRVKELCEVIIEEGPAKCNPTVPKQAKTRRVENLEPRRSERLRDRGHCPIYTVSADSSSKHTLHSSDYSYTESDTSSMDDPVEQAAKFPDSEDAQISLTNWLASQIPQEQAAAAAESLQAANYEMKDFQSRAAVSRYDSNFFEKHGLVGAHADRAADLVLELNQPATESPRAQGRRANITANKKRKGNNEDLAQEEINTFISTKMDTENADKCWQDFHQNHPDTIAKKAKALARTYNSTTPNMMEKIKNRARKNVRGKNPQYQGNGFAQARQQQQQQQGSCKKPSAGKKLLKKQIEGAKQGVIDLARARDLAMSRLNAAKLAAGEALHDKQDGNKLAEVDKEMADAMCLYNEVEAQYKAKMAVLQQLEQQQTAGMLAGGALPKPAAMGKQPVFSATAIAAVSGLLLNSANTEKVDLTAIAAAPKGDTPDPAIPAAAQSKAEDDETPSLLDAAAARLKQELLAASGNSKFAPKSIYTSKQVLLVAYNRDKKGVVAAIATPHNPVALQKPVETSFYNIKSLNPWLPRALMHQSGEKAPTSRLAPGGCIGWPLHGIRMPMAYMGKTWEQINAEWNNKKDGGVKCE